MPVFGDLSDFPLTELLPVVAFRTGALKIALEEQGTISEIYIQNHTVCGIRKEGHYLEPLEAHQVLRDLLRRTSGLFWFDPDAEPPKTNCLSWPVHQIILEFAEEQDEAALLQHHLPTPETTFELAGEPRSYQLPLSQSIFFEKARPHLERGTTVEALATLLGLSVPHVALHLHKLHLAGFVAPRRAFRPPTPAAGQSNVLARLWRALARNRL